MYKENPKTAGSGIVCGIPQTGRCPMGCEDCFFQSGRSFLEPLDENLPNMPESLGEHEILRVNDGNDSNVDRDLVISSTDKFVGRRFFNTSIPRSFSEPWVLTVNPGKKTDTSWIKIDPTDDLKLMFVRFRTNMWNLDLARDAIQYYAEELQVPVVLTFMAYFTESVPTEYRKYYSFRKRTLNSYWVINFDAWKSVMDTYGVNPLVYSCSGPDNFKCAHCGNCLREFYRVSNL